MYPALEMSNFRRTCRHTLVRRCSRRNLDCTIIYNALSRSPTIVRLSSNRHTMVPLSLRYLSMYVPGIRNVKFSLYLPSYARTQVQQKKFRLYDHLQCIVTFSYNRTIIVPSIRDGVLRSGMLL